MDMNMNFQIEQRLGLSQKQVQSLHILEMNNEQLENLIRKEEMENPFFETQADSEEIKNKKMEMHWLSSSQTKSHIVSIENDEELQKEATADNDTLADYLWQQVNWNEYTKQQQRVIRYLMDCLDNKGFLVDAPNELARILGTNLQTVQFGLKLIKSLEPAGIGAANLGECLELQLRRRGIKDEKIIAVARYHLKDLARGRFGVIASKLKLTVAQVRNSFSEIRKLNPNPISGLIKEQAGYVIPDVLCTRLLDTWQIEINDKWMGSIGLSPYYCRMASNSDDSELADYAMKKIAQAKFVISCIEKRRQTLKDVSQLIAERQSEFLLCGGALKPLCMKQIAEELSVHPSTVSRAVKNKYLQCRRGCFAFNKLMTPAVSLEENGKNVGRTQVLQMLQSIIEKEDRHNPMSDEVLSKKMHENGVQISRRTVAKYRDMLGIAGTFQRKAI